MLLGIIDDHSRLLCHLQWYLDETAESLIHGLCQAFMKRGRPRALMTDNGAAMVAEETTNGLAMLGVLHQTTLPYSPHHYVGRKSHGKPGGISIISSVQRTAGRIHTGTVFCCIPTVTIRCIARN
jgi:hypothetical protein